METKAFAIIGQIVAWANLPSMLNAGGAMPMEPLYIKSHPHGVIRRCHVWRLPDLAAGSYRPR